MSIVELPMMEIDEFTQNAREWRMAAEHTFHSATLLFRCEDPFVLFSAALLGHHALEMMLKSALIREGFQLQKGKPIDGYVWGHKLQDLAALLESKRPDFSTQVAPYSLIPLLSCNTYLARYDAFFDELRYPRASPHVDSLGPGGDEAMLLTELMDRIRPFAFPLSAGETPGPSHQIFS